MFYFFNINPSNIESIKAQVNDLQILHWKHYQDIFLKGLFHVDFFFLNMRFDCQIHQGQKWIECLHLFVCLLDFGTLQPFWNKEPFWKKERQTVLVRIQTENEQRCLFVPVTRKLWTFMTFYDIYDGHKWSHFHFFDCWLIVTFITWKSNLVSLLEGICSSNPWKVDFSVFGGLQESNRRPRVWQSRTLTN